MVSIDWALAAIRSIIWVRDSSSRVAHWLWRTELKPLTDVNGVRSSCETVARKVSFNRSASRNRATSSRSWSRRRRSSPS